MKLSFRKTSKQQLPADKARHARFRGLIYLATYLSILPGIANATVLETLNNFFGYLTGDIGKIVAALAIVGVGFGCFFMGKISKAHALYVVLGIGIIFGAKVLLGMLTA